MSEPTNDQEPKPDHRGDPVMMVSTTPEPRPVDIEVIATEDPDGGEGTVLVKLGDGGSIGISGTLYLEADHAEELAESLQLNADRARAPEAHKAPRPADRP